MIFKIPLVTVKCSEGLESIKKMYHYGVNKKIQEHYLVMYFR